MEVELQPGDCLADRYVILEEIGRGGFGVVYRAVQEGVNRHVALKTIRRHVSDIQGFDFIEAFRREALLTSKLKHPNTITLFDYGETRDGMLYLVTEFLDGETLYERLWRDKEMSSDVAVHIAKQIAKSLGEAHSNGIIHGDLKPANIFLCQMYGEQDFVKVLDFGIAKIIGEVDPAGLGTPEYMSPEQFSGQPLLAASDVYSLGLIIYEMLVGTRPFEDKDTQKLAQRHLMEPLPPLPPEIERSDLGHVIRRATNKEPDKRYDNGMSIFKALDSLGNLRRPSAAIRLPPATATPPKSSGGTSERPSMLTSPPSHTFTAPHSTRNHAPIVIPMTGRESERHWLHARFQGVRKKERGRIVLMGGAAGLGKSRLGQWLVEESQTLDALAGSGSHQKNSTRAMGALADALAEALGFPRRVGLDHAVGRIEQTISEAMGRPLSSVERNALVALYSHIDPETFEARPLAGLLVALSQSRTLVLHLDNIRWTDETTLSLLSTLAEMLSELKAKLLVLLSLRRETLPSIPKLATSLKRLVLNHRSVVPWTIGAMSPMDTREVVRLTLTAALEQVDFEDGHPSPQLIDIIVSRSCGNPLYVRQIVRHLLKHEKLSPSGQGIQLKQGVQIDDITPTRIGQLMRSRLKQVLNHSKQDKKTLGFLLRRIALLGQEVPHALLQSTLKREAKAGNEDAALVITKLNDLLQELSEQDIIARGERFDREGHRIKIHRFTHPLMHQVLTQQLEELPEASSLHRFAALAMQKHHSASQDLDAFVDKIGAHFEKSGERHEAVRFFRKAARQRCLSGRWGEAAELLERCRALCAEHDELMATKLRIIVALSYLKLILGAFADFEALQVLGLRLAENLGAQDAIREFTLQAGIMAIGAGRLEQAEKLLEQATTGFEHHRAKTSASLTGEERNLGLVDLWMTMEPLHPTIGHATGLFFRNRVQRELYQLRNADRFLQQAAELYRNIQHSWGLAMCQMELGELAMDRGQSKLSQKLLDQAFRGLGELPPPPELVHAQYLKARTLICRGLLTPARELLIDILTHMGETNRPLATRCHALLGQVLTSLGHTDEALEHFEEAIARSRVHGARLTLLQNLLDYTTFLLEMEDAQRATTHLNEAIKIARASKTRRYTPEMQLLLGRLEDLCGRPQEAMDWYSRSQKLTSKSGDQLNFIKAHALIGRLVRHENAPLLLSAAFIHLKEALHLSEEAGAVLDGVFRTEEAIAEACVRVQKTNKADELLGHAISGWQHIGNGTEAHRLKAVRTRITP